MNKKKEAYEPIEVTLIEFQVERGIAVSVTGNVKQYMEFGPDNDNDYTESEGNWEEY